MKKLTQKQAEQLKQKLINLNNACRAINKLFKKRGIIDECGSANDELSEDTRDAVEMVAGAGEFDFLLEHLDDITQ